jgi:peptide/nickel transport system permease protein
MNRVLLARLIDLVVVLFGVSIIVFLMIRLIPGDAVAIMLGANTEITPERMAELNRRVGLDRPIVEQYLIWAGAALRGDFGTSLWTGTPRRH